MADPMEDHALCGPEPEGDTCPRCGEAVDPNWFCSEGYCPTCCQETDEGADDGGE